MIDSGMPPAPRDANDADWHYVEDGAQKGPASTAEIQALLQASVLYPESQVWRRGMDRWRPVRETELITTVANVPPPVPGDQIPNALVWIVAILPLVFGLIDAALASQPSVGLGRALAPHMGGSFREPEIPWFIPAAINSVLLYWDERRLNKAGYSSRWLPAMAIGLTPVYLFVRAKRTNQRPSYAITWIALTVISLLLVASAQT